MLSVRTREVTGLYVPGETIVSFTTTHSIETPRTALFWCPGNNQTAASDYTSYGSLLQLLAQTFDVYIADYGGSTFGNDTGIARVEDVYTYAEVDEAVLVGASMGNAVMMNYTVRNPEKVIALAGIIPALSLYTEDPEHPAGDEIDAAYPPAWDPENPDHYSHHPIGFANEIPDTIPVGLWMSTNDTLCTPAHADAFCAARPSTKRVDFGAYGHGGVTVAVPLAYEWLRSVAG
jgi:predicted alpha/beta hydrolase family esterase